MATASKMQQALAADTGPGKVHAAPRLWRPGGTRREGEREEGEREREREKTGRETQPIGRQQVRSGG